MSLLEEARARKPRPPGPSCKVRRALIAHPDLADEIIELLRDRTVPHVDAAAEFHAHDIAIGRQVVESHRNAGCVHCAHHGIDLSPLVPA